MDIGLPMLCCVSAPLLGDINAVTFSQHLISGEFSQITELQLCTFSVQMNHIHVI